MGKFEKLNRGKRLFDIDAKDAPFVKREELHVKDPNAVHVLKAFYRTGEGLYGRHYVAITPYNGALVRVDMPQHLDETFDAIAEYAELVNAIKRGECGFRVYKYDSKTRKGCYGIELVDIEPDEVELMVDRG